MIGKRRKSVKPAFVILFKDAMELLERFGSQ